MNRFHTIFAIIALLFLGLMSGFFFAFAVDVAPAMTHLDASGYVTTQQWINRVVRNALFGGVYFGSVIFPFLAAGSAYLAVRKRVALCWLVIGVFYFIVAFGITRSINVPINDALALWNPAAPPADWEVARDTWNRSNLWRTVGSVLSFCAGIILIVLGGSNDSMRILNTTQH